MRIALVAPLVSAIAQPYLGGAQALLADLAQGLIQRGHTVTLFARDDSFVPGISIEPVTVPKGVLPADFSVPLQERAADAGFFTQANLFLELFLQLQRRSAEFDVIHIHAFDWPAFACSTLIRDVPVIHTLHLPAVSPEINMALQVLDRQGHPLTLITVSYACAETYANYTPIDQVIYNGLDLDAIPFMPRLPVGRLGRPEPPLLFAGRIAPEKGVEAAIEIAERAGYRLLIAGGIYDRRYYKERIEPKLQRAGEQVTYLGQLERLALWKIMGQSLGLLFPIEWDEPFGLTAVEAMATGTPVIAFRRGAAEEVIRHGETGFLVEPGECAHAAALVDDLFDIPRVHCRVHVETHFALEQMLDAYEQVYSALIK
ncbi:MAG TPA: glycosyltransferase [Ktedonobacteraceae bacterium]|nr:glycosyltransferase [Ktedonobacteraceae bacterium]